MNVSNGMLVKGLACLPNLTSSINLSHMSFSEPTVIGILLDVSHLFQGPLYPISNPTLNPFTRNSVFFLSNLDAYRYWLYLSRIMGVTMS